MMSISSLIPLAAAPPATGQGSSWLIIGYVAFFLGMMYFMLWRPQQKQQREHQEMINKIKAGDRVITSSGIHGTVTTIKDKTILVRVADKVDLEFSRASVATVVMPEAAPKT